MDSYDYYKLYAQARAEECQTLKEAYSCYLSGGQNGDAILVNYVKLHDKDKDFEQEVYWLSYDHIARLLEEVLFLSDYNVFQPWCKRAYLYLLSIDAEKLPAYDVYWRDTVAETYDFYKKSWDKVDETLD